MLWLILIPIVHCKYMRDTIYITEDQPAAYISKFGVDIGTGSWEMKARLSKGNKDYGDKTYPVQLLLYRDRDFTEQAFTCETSSSAIAHQIDLPSDGKWSEMHSGQLGEPDTPHIWFLVLADCDGYLGPKARVKVDLTILSGDESHLSVELKGMKRIYIVACIILSILWGSNIWKLYRFFTTRDSVETNIIMLNIAIALEFVSLVCHIVHISSYEYNGKGISAFEFFGNAFGLLSEFIMMILLLLIAHGWTLKYKEFPDPDIYIPCLLYTSDAADE